MHSRRWRRKRDGEQNRAAIMSWSMSTHSYHGRGSALKINQDIAEETTSPNIRRESTSLAWWSFNFTPTDSRAPSPWTAAAAGCRRARRSTRRRTGRGLQAGGWTCTWGRGSRTGPRYLRRPGWRSGRSRGRSRGVHRRGASGGPRRRCNTGSAARRGPATGSRSGSCSPGCRHGWSSAWWVTWEKQELKSKDLHTVPAEMISQQSLIDQRLADSSFSNVKTFCSSLFYITVN